MLRSILYMLLLVCTTNLLSSDEIDSVIRGYQANRVRKTIRYCNAQETANLRNHPSYTSDKKISEDTFEVVETYYHVQLPTYHAITGTLVTDREKWNTMVDQNMYAKIQAIEAREVTELSLFPIQIDHNQRYINPIMQDKVIAIPSIQLISFQEKQAKDKQAAYALLSRFNQIRYRILGGTLPDPYQTL